MSEIVDIGDLCTHCHRDTSFGSGLFVNRIPSMTEDEDGYLCPECQMFDCDRCNKKFPYKYRLKRHFNNKNKY